MTHSPETIEKLRTAARARVARGEFKSPTAGRSLSVEHRAKISTAKTGKPSHYQPRATCVTCRRVVVARMIPYHSCDKIRLRIGDSYRGVFVQTNGEGPWPCEECGLEVASIGKGRGQGNVHHLDEDRKNSAPENLVMLHNACHKRQHPMLRGADGRFIGRQAKVQP